MTRKTRFSKCLVGEVHELAFEPSSKLNSCCVDLQGISADERIRYQLLNYS